MIDHDSPDNCFGDLDTTGFLGVQARYHDTLHCNGGMHEARYTIDTMVMPTRMLVYAWAFIAMLPMHESKVNYE